MLTIRNLFLLQVKTEQKSWWLVLFLIILAFFGNASKTSAQITTDATLPNNSIALPNADGDLITITGGTTAGNNLFHSFQEFSVLENQTAFFNNALTTENILSRVTGSSVSNIEGLIRANGSANLFLINPNGIIFGPNAALDIGGSFVGSTAESIQFSDGSFYSAVDPQAPPLLTINIPLGLQYGAEPGNIIVQGIGNNTGFRDPSVNDLSLVKDFRPTGLQVAEGNTLALIGGNIALDGGNLTAAEGHIELGSVEEGLVKFDGNEGIGAFDYQDITEFLDIALVNAASVEVSGNSSGTVNVQGQNISLADASAILANTSGNGIAGSITLNGAESVQVTGISQTQIPFVSYVSTGTAPGSTGAGADLNINTSYLLVAGGAIVDSPVFGSGDGGDINVNAERIELISGSPVAGASGLISPIVPGATGNGGNINVTTDSLLVAGGAQAFTLSFSSGKGGDFNIKAQDIELNGTSPNGAPSGLFATTFANGDGGNLNIDTNSLTVLDGAEIGSTVSGIGTAGNIAIKANTIELTDLAALETPSSISASVREGATGVGGDITIETNSLSLSGGTQINSSVFGEGNGGNVNISASEINLNGYSPAANRSSGIFATVIPGATGNSGNMTITTDNLQVSEGAQIAVSTGGSGAAGNLTLTASDSVELHGNAIAEGGGSSGLFSNAVFADGNGGNLDLTTNHLMIKDGATISASNFLSGNAGVPPGTGRAGNINLNAQNIELDGVAADTPASITAATFAGGGGNIVLNSKTITASNGAQVTAETTGEGAGGLIQVNTDNLTLNSGAVLSSSTSAAGDAGTISVTSNSLEIANQGTITTNSTGAGQAGNITLNVGSDLALTNGGQITSEAQGDGNGGNIELTTNALKINSGGLLSTSTAANGNAGSINLKVETANFSDAGTGVFSEVKDTATGDGGNIAISATEFNLNNQAQVSVNSTGLGQAGNIAIASDSLTLDEGKITATASQTGGGNIVLESETIRASNGAQVTAETTGEGAGGLIQVNTDNLTLNSGAVLSSSTSAAGDAGTISVTSNSLDISHQGTITTNSTGAGQAGSITLKVDSDLALTNGGQITSEAQGDGNGGNIELTTNALKINSGGLLSTSTAANGNAGSINLKVETANFSDAGTGVFSEVEETATGDGGSISISATEFNLNNQAQVSVNSTGLGQAGNIAIASDSLTLDEGKITATSTQTGGGDIKLVTNSLTLDNNSLISTSVLDSTGGGGNILIDNSGFIIGKNNSDIKADAVFGPGGNIQINAQGIFFDLDSEITASSRFGTDGVVEININESDKKLGTVYFPDRISATEAVIVSSCPVPETNTFMVTGAGGLPENPSSYLRGRTVWQDTRRLASNGLNSEAIQPESTSVQSKGELENAESTSIVESQGWIINHRGKVELIAANPTNISPNAWYQGIKCGDI